MRKIAIGLLAGAGAFLTGSAYASDIYHQQRIYQLRPDTAGSHGL